MSKTDNKKVEGIGKGYAEKYGFSVPENYVFKSKKGLSREIVEEISWMKGEPDWMRQARLEALDIFLKKPTPSWGNTQILNSINFDNIYYYLKSTDKTAES